MARLSNSKKLLAAKKEINSSKKSFPRGGAGMLNTSKGDLIDTSNIQNNNNNNNNSIITHGSIQGNSTPNDTILTDNNNEPKSKDILVNASIKEKIENIINDVKADHSIFTEYKTTVDLRKNITSGLINLLLKKLQLLESQSSLPEINHVNKEIRIFLLDNDLSSKSDDLTDESINEDKIQINKLREENIELKKKLTNMTSTDVTSKRSVKHYESIIEKKEIITDMLESICGMSITEVDESDPNNLIFDCTQSGINGEITYKLSLCRTDGQDRSFNDDDDDDESINDSGVVMVYTPLFAPVNELKQILPEYFFESLTFPVETLPQFYQKLSRALNRSN